MGGFLGNILASLDNTQWSNLSALATVLGVAVNSGVLIATLRYVNITRRMMVTENQNQTKNMEFQSNKIRNDTLIDLTRTWGSKEFITARNTTYHLLEENQFSPKAVYAELNEMATKKGFTENPWINVSLIAQFIARIGRLSQADQINRRDTKYEFESALSFWAPILIPIYNSMDDGKTVSALINQAYECTSPGVELPPYPYYDEKQSAETERASQPNARL